MFRQLRHVSLCALITLGCFAPALADQWNERTVLTFSDPVMVPGATLQPGTYVFELGDPTTAHDAITVFTKDGHRPVASMQAVPTKRPSPSSDIVLKFSPTEPGTPPALKAWFYPGSIYGHEFVYPEKQAREIAQRSRTLVLSSDGPGDSATGTLHTFNADGLRSTWKGDEATTREWESWSQNRKSDRAHGAATSGESAKSDATMIEANFKGLRVDLDALEDNPSKYMGQSISVDGVVDQVLGPRLFKIDEPNWADLEGELLVTMPTNLAAIVRAGDRITVHGKVQPFVKTEIERDLDWMSFEPETIVKLSTKPVIVAQRIVGGDDQRVLMVAVAKSHSDASNDRAVGTAGTSGTATALTNASAIGRADDEIVGREVRLENAKVSATSTNGGFFVSSPDRQIYVKPADAASAKVSIGDTVSIDGLVMEMPSGMRNRLTPPASMNRDVYIYATSVGSK